MILSLYILLTTLTSSHVLLDLVLYSVERSVISHNTFARLLAAPISVNLGSDVHEPLFVD